MATRQPATNKPTHRNQHPPALTRAKQRTYLQVLSQTGNHGKACKAAVIDPSSPCQWASKNENFRKMLEHARELGEQVVLRQYESQMDDILLPDTPPTVDEFAKTQNSRFFRMKRLDPRYRDNAPININLSGPSGTIFEVVDIPQSSAPRLGAGTDHADGQTVESQENSRGPGGA